MLFDEEIPETLSCWGCRRLILLSLKHCFLRSLECCSIFSSVVLSYGSGLLWAYCHSCVLRSARVPNLAMSQLRTFTTGTPGSLIAVVVGDVRTTALPGANVSQRPRKSRFERFETFLAKLNSRDCSVRDIVFVDFGWKMNQETDLTLSLLYLLPHPPQPLS